MAAAVLLAPVSAPKNHSAVDQQWMTYLRSPPAAAVEASRTLGARADGLARALPARLNVSGDVDLVCSAGGNLDAYYLGASMVFARAKALSVARRAGASAGAQTSFELALKGELATLRTHLAYGELCAEHGSLFGNHTHADALIQYHHWALMGEWQSQTFAARLPSLDGKVSLALSCGQPSQRALLRVLNFTNAGDQATEAFIATGSPTIDYQGQPCGDGWATSGKDQTPLWQDHARPQIVINLHRSGWPNSMMYAPLVTADYVALLKQGQDEAAAFLKTGRSPSVGGITLCPADASVGTNVCATEAAAAPGSAVPGSSTGASGVDSSFAAVWMVDTSACPSFNVTANLSQWGISPGNRWGGKGPATPPTR